MVSPHYIGDSQEVSTLDDCNDDEFPSKIVTLFKSSQEKIDSAPLKLNPSPPPFDGYSSYGNRHDDHPSNYNHSGKRIPDSFPNPKLNKKERN